MAKLYGDLVGERFGKLTVIRRNDEYKLDKDGNVVKDANGNPKIKAIAWLCKCDCGNEITVRDNTLKTETLYKRSCKKCPKERNPNFKSKVISAEEQEELDALYEYVRSNVMGYNSDYSLSNKMVLRLKGMRNGQFIHNKNQKEKANYSYTVILNTFKFCVIDIKRALSSKSFYTEEIKFNYICSIVENNLNTVAKRMKEAERVKKEAENMDISHSINYVNGFKVREDSNENTKYDDLW